MWQKTKVMISCAVTAQLIGAFDACAKIKFSHGTPLCNKISYESVLTS